VNSNEHDGKFLVGLFLGGLLGAVILFLLGTKEGKHAGKLLEERGKDLMDDLEDRIGDLEKKGKELVRQGEDIKDEVMETIEDKKEELTQGATEKLDTALAHIEKLQEQGLQTTTSLRKHIFKNIPKKSK